MAVAPQQVNPTSLGKLRVVIAGASFGGLATALELADRGAQVLIIERSASLDTFRGGAMMVQPNVLEFCRHHGIALPEGLTLERRWQFDDKGRMATRSVPLGETHMWASVRGAFLNAVRGKTGIRVEEGRSVTAIEPGEQCAQVVTADGSRYEVDLAIDASGARSKLLAPPAEYAGYVAYRAYLPLAALDLDLQPRFCNILREYFSAGAVSIHFPVLFNGEKHVSSTVFLAEDDLERRFGDAARGGIVVPSRMSEATSHFKAKVDGLFPRSVFDLLDNPANTYFARIVEDLPGQSLPVSLIGDRVARVADAAGAVRSFRGAATALAIDDAVALAEELQTAAEQSGSRNAVQPALCAYDERRLGVRRYAVGRGRKLDAQFGLPSPSVAEQFASQERMCVEAVDALGIPEQYVQAFREVFFQPPGVRTANCTNLFDWNRPDGSDPLLKSKAEMLMWILLNTRTKQEPNNPFVVAAKNVLGEIAEVVQVAGEPDYLANLAGNYELADRLAETALAHLNDDQPGFVVVDLESVGSARRLDAGSSVRSDRQSLSFGSVGQAARNPPSALDATTFMI